MPQSSPSLRVGEVCSERTRERLLICTRALMAYHTFMCARTASAKSRTPQL